MAIRAITYAFTLAPQKGDFGGETAVITYSGRDAKRREADKVTITSPEGVRLVNDLLAQYDKAGGLDLPASFGLTVYVQVERDGTRTVRRVRCTYNAETGPGEDQVRPIKATVISAEKANEIPEIGEAVSAVLGNA